MKYFKLQGYLFNKISRKIIKSHNKGVINDGYFTNIKYIPEDYLYVFNIKENSFYGIECFDFYFVAKPIKVKKISLFICAQALVDGKLNGYYRIPADEKYMKNIIISSSLEKLLEKATSLKFLG